MKFKKVRNMFLAAVLTCSMCAVPVFAAPDDSTSMESLESQKAQAESEVSDLQTQLNTLMTKMNDLESQLIAKGQEISQAEEDLQAAEEKRQQQYEDMKLRIKYMYEEGDNSAIERVCKAGNIAEVLSQAEYVQKVHTYDRNMLKEYANTVAEIDELRTTLEEDNAKLQSMMTEYEEQSGEIASTIESKRAEVENLDNMIQEAARAALEAQKKAEEEAAKRAQNNTPPAPAIPSVPNTPQSPSDNGSSGVVEPPSYNPVTGNAVVDRAYGKLGCAYGWGACGPDVFDCSGFVSYCLTGSYMRLGTTYTFMAWNQVSNPQPGDVCVNWTHCGIYIGNGRMIHAADYGIGVIVGPVQGGMIYVRY